MSKAIVRISYDIDVDISDEEYETLDEGEDLDLIEELFERAIDIIREDPGKNRDEELLGIEK